MKYLVWKNNRISNFVLGTAQLGMKYGIANVQGQPFEKQACEIVETAWELGVNCFDTAQIYNGEPILGKALKQVISDTKIVTKLSPYLKPSATSAIIQSIEKSRQELGVDQLWCLMLHKAGWLDAWDEGLGQTLTNARKEGAVKYLGVSVYRYNEAREALEHPDIQVIQVPCNIWDQKMLKEGIFDLAKKKGKLCFVRSIFLQGLLLLPPEKVAEKLPAAAKASQKWYKLAEKYNMEPLELAVGFAKSLRLPLVIGVENHVQLKRDFLLLEKVELAEKVLEDTSFRVDDEDIIIPSRWRIQEN